MIEVVLTQQQWDEAAAYGDKRRDHHAKRTPAKHKDGGDARERDRLGAVAEAALARHFGPDVYDDWLRTKAYVPGTQSLNIPCDVGVNLHVRSTLHLSGGIVLHGDRRADRKPDPDDGVFVLAVVCPKFLTIRYPGWVYGRDGKLDAYWRHTGTWAKQPAYCVPQSALRPADQIPPEAVR